MISYLLTNWLLNGVSVQFFKLSSYDVIFLELVPIFFSHVENDGVTEMQDRGIFSLELFIHNSLVHDELFFKLAVRSVVVELNGLHEFLLVISVLLEGLDDGHTSLVSLNDVHGKISYEVLVVLSDEVRSYDEFLLVIFVVLAVVVLSGQLEERILGVSIRRGESSDVLFQSGNGSGSVSIFWRTSSQQSIECESSRVGLNFGIVLGVTIELALLVVLISFSIPDHDFVSESSHELFKLHLPLGLHVV